MPPAIKSVQKSSLPEQLRDSENPDTGEPKILNSLESALVRPPRAANNDD
jgi:hypothetical protein